MSWQTIDSARERATTALPQVCDILQVTSVPDDLGGSIIALVPRVVGAKCRVATFEQHTGQTPDRITDHALIPVYLPWGTPVQPGDIIDVYGVHLNVMETDEKVTGIYTTALCGGE